MITVFWDIGINISEEPYASITRVERSDYPED
jgi:hypothetical protein